VFGRSEKFVMFGISAEVKVTSNGVFDVLGVVTVTVSDA
jgi:hypothetical protein